MWPNIFYTNPQTNLFWVVFTWIFHFEQHFLLSRIIVLKIKQKQNKTKQNKKQNKTKQKQKQKQKHLKMAVTIQQFLRTGLNKMYGILANFQISERGTNERKKIKKRNIPKFPIHYYTKIAAKTGTHDKIILFFASKRGTAPPKEEQLASMCMVILLQIMNPEGRQTQCKCKIVVENGVLINFLCHFN